jgi:hypothetical protein
MILVWMLIELCSKQEIAQAPATFMDVIGVGVLLWMSIIIHSNK